MRYEHTPTDGSEGSVVTVQTPPSLEAAATGGVSWAEEYGGEQLLIDLPAGSARPIVLRVELRDATQVPGRGQIEGPIR